VNALPAATADTLPALRARAGALSGGIKDVYVGFRVRFYTAEEAFNFGLKYRFLCPRSAMRNETDDVVWVGYRAWAFDFEDAQMQAAVAVRWAAVKARVRHIPTASDAEVREAGLVADVDRALRERAEMLARLDEPTPFMHDMSRTGVATPHDTLRRTAGRLGAGPLPPSAPPPAAAAPAPAPEKPAWWRRRKGRHA
jgi:hypothetical protein